MLKFAPIMLLVFHFAIFRNVLADSSTDEDKSGVHSPSKERSPDSAFVGSLNPKNSDSQSNRECFCTYDYDDNFVKAQIGHKKLKRGDKIMQGETVSFACKFSGVLLWQNGFRFFGKADMTCNSCKIWESKDLPTCSNFAKPNAVIGSEEDLKILPGGTVDLRKGDSYRFFCSSIWKQPQWEYGEKMGVAVNKTQVHGPGRLVFVSYLDIMQAVHEHNGTYECFTQGQFGQKVGSSVLNVRVDDRSCGDPGYLKNGRRTGNLFTFPNKVEYDCEEGYKLKGLRARYCQEGGEWSGRLPTCELIYCSVPDDPVNGRVRLSSLEYGTELIYECNVGYRLQKHEPRICSEDGSWSNAEPQCIEAKCEAPPPPVHGSVKLHGEIKVGSLATYSCDRGKKLHGASLTKCLSTGEWTFDAPRCLSSCSVPSIQNGETGRMGIRFTSLGIGEEFVKVHSGEEINSNEVLILRCSDGFSPAKDSRIFEKGQLEVKCIDGTWSSSLQCYETSCHGEPPSTPNGTPVVMSRLHGHVIWYRCRTKDYVKMEGIVTCHFGSWIGTAPKCLIAPCYTKDLNYPGLVKPPQAYLESDEDFDIRCESGFRRGNNLERVTCSRGKWNITQNPCIQDHVNCPRFSFSSELDVRYSDSLNVGSIATFSCSQTTRSLVGSSVSVCQEDGRWSRPLPSCEDSKCSIQDLHSSISETIELDMTGVNSEFVSSGYEILLKCGDKSVLEGNPKVLCEGGKWKLGSNRMECVLGCVLDIDPSSHLLIQPEKNSYRLGEMVLLSCPPGQELSDDVERLMCLGGAWSHWLPFCKEAK